MTLTAPVNIEVPNEKAHSCLEVILNSRKKLRIFVSIELQTDCVIQKKQ